MHVLLLYLRGVCCARAGDLSELEAIAATVSGKENVAGDAAVIGSKARELELLVPKIMARQAARADTVLDPQSALQALIPAFNYS